ncbi:hypothetical protein [Archangium lansingense]|uniref:Protein kinase n=1 Tax=Archangium lansingense TaxID=2995310 RepID=A0ABT4AGS8_9BACT|nr:hypothetical protein [Archangium lansinium]MCY1080888.1 hypothetical protein [Archangium lansinium]
MDEQKQAETSEENPEQLGPYQLQEQVPQAARGQEELYRATHETSGATALVLKLNADQGAVALKDWRVSLISSSASTGYVAMQVEQTPWSRAPDRQSVESLVFTFESVSEAVRRMARAVPENYESRPRWRLGLSMASAAAVCALLLALVHLAPESRPPNSPEPLTSAPPAPMCHEEPTGVAVDSDAPPNALTLVQTEDPNPSGITYPLPAKPFGNQAKAPCKPRKGEVEINGGCWVALEKRPPCYDDQAEYQGKCYLPVAERPKPEPSAIQP